MYNPVSTYRIQFQKAFPFSEFEKIIPYLQQLGISTVYASPVFQSVPGSVHGYDVVDPQRIHPETGTREQLDALTRRLKELGIGWIQDIVPNHMGYHPGNGRLMDVLENGLNSRYAGFFDITWNSDAFEGRLMAPFLGGSLEEVIQKDELRLTVRQGGIFLSYFDQHYPVQPRTYAALLELKKRPGAGVKEAISRISALEATSDRNDYANAWKAIKSAVFSSETKVKALQAAVETVNSNKDMLTRIAKQQLYQLCHWQETDHQINYRRFFTINGLICLNMDQEEVFEDYHALVRQLMEEGTFNGLRVDHIDGLSDPSSYLDRLRELAGEEAYITVEKILEPGEQLPHHWPVQGTTGYDFLAMADALFGNRKNETAFTLFYRRFTNDRKPVHHQLFEKKSDILYHYMEGELDNLFLLFTSLRLADGKNQSSVHPDDLKNVIAELLIQCPVYRFYGNRFPLDEPEASAVKDLLDHLRGSGACDDRAVSILEDILLHRPSHSDEDYRQRVARFYQRCMQFTGPLMAKGMEDTLMYTYNRFIGHNEVGDSPEQFGSSADEFHQAMEERQENWPLSLNATSTHDTKRGEDVRARLNVLSDLPEEWFSAVEHWEELSGDHKQDIFPDANDRYLIYQALVGHYPMPGQEEDGFEERFCAYIRKALREAKQHSSWSAPDEAYEGAAQAFARQLLDRGGRFFSPFQIFLSRIADYGIINSLSQLLLKFACPGVPDIYQGGELWDLHFVDPDNRQPVDYTLRQNWLDELQRPPTGADLLRQLWKERYSGKIKLWLTQTLLAWRKEQKEFLQQAEYLPLNVEGSHRNHVLAFGRRHKQQIFIIAVPLHLAELPVAEGKEAVDVDWKDTAIVLPGGLAGAIEHVLTGERFQDRISVQQVFAVLPFALLKGQLREQKRAAGILLHLTSLPSAFGIGDMGREARVFAGFLYRSRQHYWQVLPLNPTEAGQGHSPYSAVSSRAGNPLLISPELLAADKLLDADELRRDRLPVQDQVDYAKAEEIKNALFDRAYRRFGSGGFSSLENEFGQFCTSEDNWLNDYALYALMKKLHGGKPWYEWEKPFRQRSASALQEMADGHREELGKIKWLQFIFFRQWKELKDYCNNLTIQLVGDIPFYISYDSADVWANPGLFALDEEGRRTGVAGVPPDAFSADGQLWGMPVFNWEAHKKTNYAWWIGRLKKNRELFDLVRLDHFRAFDAYWEVAAGEQTAKNGTWVQGPGKHFFEVVQSELGELPFIAEDLGDITESVYHLRDAFHLPGMKVLQFAFSADLPYSPHINHHHQPNFIVYTGTHDNNTTRGWYRTETDDKTKERIAWYLGMPVDGDRIHDQLGRLAYSSVARMVILPLQDVLGLDERARMNTPSSAHGNWSWRLLPGQLSAAAEHQLKEWTLLYDRQ